MHLRSLALSIVAALALVTAAGRSGSIAGRRAWTYCNPLPIPDYPSAVS